jgi:hypothetical protein
MYLHTERRIAGALGVHPSEIAEFGGKRDK